LSDGPEPRPVADSRSELIRWMGVQDANTAGFVHGGMVMKTCDEAASIAAIRHCGLRVVTAGMDRMTFTEPVQIGDLLRCQASVNAAWRTSMEVGVRVEAENPRTGESRHTSTAYVTMVGLDDEGRPTPVPGVLPETDDERRRQREAELRRANRLAERDQILAESG
jgi:acyl-CoA hydrolase